MSTSVLHPRYSPALDSVIPSKSFISRFLAWCDAQNENRLLWLGVILTLHGCVLTPIAGAVVLISGASFALFMLTMIGMALALVTNLAALPTKISIPAFALSVVIDALVVVVSLSTALAA